VPASLFGQDMIHQVMVGPNNGQVRIVVAFIEPSEKEYKMQSMIIDLKPDKKKEQAETFQVDLTSTIRSLSTGEKKQKILILRLEKSDKLQLKCDGKWQKKDADPAIDQIIEAVKTVIQNVPLDSKEKTEVNLSDEVEQKVLSVLNSLDTEELPCLRNLM
jgi:hypothetical protein